MADNSAIYHFVYCDEVGSVLIAPAGYMQPPQPASSGQACVNEEAAAGSEARVNTNLAQKIILTFGFTSLTFVALLTVVDSESQMAGSLGFIKSLILPLLIALALFLLLTHILLPAYRRHRQRYAQYLPVSNSWRSNLTSSTTTLRQRLSSAFVVLLPSRWADRRFARHAARRTRVVDAEGERADEEMGDMDEDAEGCMVPGRRDAVSLDQRGPPGGMDSNRRLSRELEEGFRDSSDEEDGPGR